VKSDVGQAIGQDGLFGAFEPDTISENRDFVQSGNLTPRVGYTPRRGVSQQAGPRAKAEPETRSDRITAELERLIRAEAIERGENVTVDGWKFGAFQRAYAEGRLLQLAIQTAGGLS
jgi:hypothetical protein